MKGTALVTGGAKRIGRAIALALADEGFNIALHYSSSPKEAEKTAGEIEKKGTLCYLFRADFNKMKEVSSLIPSVFKKFHDCNLLINNASIFQRARLMDTDEELFNRHFNINFKTPFFLSRSFAQHSGKGHIINILDTKISRNLTEYFVYTLTKKALYEFTLMAAKELGPKIRVNGISPGLILPSVKQTREDFEKMATQVPLQKTGNTDNVISAVRFLIENKFITGEVIFVDGGEHLG